MVKITKNKYKNVLPGTGGIISAIAKKLNVTRQTVYTFLERYPEMDTLRKQEEDVILDLAESSLFTKAREGEMWATKYLLSTKGKRRGYVEKQELEYLGDNAISINVNIPKEVKELLNGNVQSNS